MLKRLFFNAYITTYSALFCASKIELYQALISNIKELNREIEDLRTVTQKHQRQLDHLQLEVAAMRTAASMMQPGNKKKSHTR